MIKSNEFSDIEFREIFVHANKLFNNGYFTGINFIKSNEKLPDESIIVHFLHYNRSHLEKIVREVNLPYQITPRFTFYAFDAKYIKSKPNFKEDYKNSIFYDEYFNIVPIEDVIKKEYRKLKVTHEELDLILPCQNIPLIDVILDIQEANKEGPFPWDDPVIIIKTKQLIETVPNFKNNTHYVSITRHKEEFYTIVNEDFIVKSLKKYIKNLCKKVKIGNLNENSIKFNLSQINIEFYDYIVKNLMPFESL